jgi:hypothetical protein
MISNSLNHVRAEVSKGAVMKDEVPRVRACSLGRRTAVIASIPIYAACKVGLFQVCPVMEVSWCASYSTDMSLPGYDSRVINDIDLHVLQAYHFIEWRAQQLFLPAPKRGSVVVTTATTSLQF